MRVAVLLIVGALVGALFVAVPKGADQAPTASAATFDPGNIISDAVFFNKSAMSEASIQSFLNSQVSSCRSGYTCLKDFRQNTTSRSADAMCSAYTGGSNETAARIIYKVSQACGINPQVLIVTLQKEQSLVTSNAPSSWAWKASMGYACPDTAACDTRYYGFYNQVYMAAWQFKRYGNPPGTSQYFTWFGPGKTVNVQWHPNASCGSSPVYIQNQATANLYYYTPYQPNRAALNAGWGTGDACSSYGNRNFFNYFTLWFGSTQNAPGVAAIDAKYNEFRSLLGDATSGYNSVSANGGGLVRAYQNGAIAWSAPRGAHILTGTMRAAFSQYGGIEGQLGWPASDVNAETANGGGSVQAFQHGAIALSNQHGAAMLKGSVRTAFSKLAGLAGPVGWPTGEQSCSGSQCKQDFQGGTITASGDEHSFENAVTRAFYSRNSSLGAQTSSPNGFTANGGGIVFAHSGAAVTYSPEAGMVALSGGVRQALRSAGGVTGYLGWPSGSSVDYKENGGGTVQPFQGGVIVTSSAGSFPLSGEIRAAYSGVGGVTGAFGWPTTTPNRHAANGGGTVQGFQRGAIVSSASGTFPISGDIRAVYGANGGVAGSFGWPVGAPVEYEDNGGGTVQAFQGAAIVSSSAGTFPLSGDIRAAYSGVGGVTGAFGWPTTAPNPQSANGGGTVQGFQRGAIVSSASGTFPISGEIRALYGENGGVAGAFGWPTTSPSVNGNGLVQGFQQAAITWTEDLGAAALTGPIRTFYGTQGGLGGDLGWPLASAVCKTSSSCYQEFEHGVIEWTSSGGAKLRD